MMSKWPELYSFLLLKKMPINIVTFMIISLK